MFAYAFLLSSALCTIFLFNSCAVSSRLSKRSCIKICLMPFPCKATSNKWVITSRDTAIKQTGLKSVDSLLVFWLRAGMGKYFCRWTEWIYPEVIASRGSSRQKYVLKTFITSYIINGSIVACGTRLVRFPLRSLDFSVVTTSQPHYGPGVDSASNRNEYQKSSWG
jgi:hypothetical protein